MWQESVDYLVYEKLALSGSFAEALNFFIYDSVKILFLLISIIFVISFLRSYFDVERVREYLSKKSEFVGNIFASLFGIVTPFCTCSAIPLFLGFLQARIPVGVTFSFLISAPLNNEIAIAMLFSLFGFKITAIYIGFGLFVAIIGGYLIGRMDSEKYILIKVEPVEVEYSQKTTTLKERLESAKEYTSDIFKKIYLYVLIGVAVGGFIHGYVPADFIAQYSGGDNPSAVLVAVLMGVPMYSNAAGVMPLVEVLTEKGMLLGTALSFMMAVTALSLPEAMILKSILHTRLIALFFSIVAVSIVAIGYIFNYIL
jgi:uncharacterized membrane protein YraQ (UPF0718 family)